MDCLGLLIVGIVIFCVIRSKSQNGNQTTKPNQPGQTRSNQPIRPSQTRPNQPMRQNPSRPNQPVGGQAGGTVSGRQGYQTGNTYAKPAAQVKPKEDILARANRNVREQQLEKQEELKARLQQKYGEISNEQKPEKPAGKEKAASVSMAEAVQRVATPPEKVKESEVNQFSPKPDRQTETNVMELQEPPTSDLMREIKDLMVKGYDGELTFSRDFVAEGIEMLNRIQM